MKKKNEQIISLIELLTSASKELDIKKTPKSILKNYPINLKLKLIHYGYNTEKKYIDALINIIKKNNYITSDLKLLYVINFKCKLDQENIKRKIISNLKPSNFKNPNKKLSAYKNTEHINNLYQLYHFNCELNI